MRVRECPFACTRELRQPRPRTRASPSLTYEFERQGIFDRLSSFYHILVLASLELQPSGAHHTACDHEQGQRGSTRRRHDTCRPSTIELRPGHRGTSRHILLVISSLEHGVGGFSSLWGEVTLTIFAPTCLESTASRAALHFASRPRRRFLLLPADHDHPPASRVFPRHSEDFHSYPWGPR